MPPNSLWLDRPDRTPYRAIDFRQKYDTVVIGAGLTGLVTALLFARAGERVAVLEARTIGAVATGNTTAKISVLQGTKLSSIASKHSHQQVRRYVQGNTAGQQWLLEYCAERGIAVQRETAYTYATTSSGLTAVRDELRVALGAGLNASYGTDTELPSMSPVPCLFRTKLNSIRWTPSLPWPRTPRARVRTSPKAPEHSV